MADTRKRRDERRELPQDADELVTRIENWIWDRAYDMQGYLEEEEASLEQWLARRRVSSDALPWDGASNLDMGGLYTMSHVESIHSRVMQVLRQSRPWVRFESSDPSAAEQATKYIKRVFDKEVPLLGFCDEWVHDALIGGLRRARVRWVRETREEADVFFVSLTPEQDKSAGLTDLWALVYLHLQSRYPKAKFGKRHEVSDLEAGHVDMRFSQDGKFEDGQARWVREGVRIRMTVRRRKTVEKARLEMCLPEDFWKSPGPLQDCHYILHRVWLTWDQVVDRVNAGIYTGIDLDADKTATADPVNQTEGGAPLVETRRLVAGQATQVPHDDLYEFVEGFILEDWGKGVLEDRFITLFRGREKIVRNVLLSAEGYPCRPFSEIAIQPVPGKPEWAWGVPGMIRQAADEVTALHNLGMNIATIRGIPFGFRDAGAEWGEDEMQVAPGKILPVDAGGSGDISRSVYFPTLNGQITELAGLAGNVDAAAKSVDGISDTQMLQAPKGRTVGQSQMQQNEVNVRFEVLFDRIVGSVAEQKGIVFLIHLLIALYQKFGRTMEVEFLSGTLAPIPFPRLAPLAFRVDIDVLQLTEEKKMKRAQAVMQTVMNPMLLQLKVVTPTQVFNAVKHVLESSGVSNPTDFIQMPPEDSQASVSPEKENVHMMSGVPQQVHPADDDEEHLISHRSFVNMLGDMPEANADPESARTNQLFSAHIRQHVLQQRAKRKSQQQSVQGLDFTNPQAVPSPGNMSFIPPAQAPAQPAQAPEPVEQGEEQ